MREKVLLVAGIAGPGALAGGVWSVAAAQLSALRQQGAEVKLVAGWVGSLEEASSDLTVDVQLFRLRNLLPGSGLRGLFSLRFLVHVVRISRGFDVVHVHLARDFITYPLVALLGIFVPKMVVVQSHGTISTSGSSLIRLFDRVTWRFIVRVPRVWLALTSHEAEDLEEFGVPRSLLKVVPNAAADPIARWQASTKLHFVYVSRLHPRKQPELVPCAILQSGLVDVRLTLAGPDQGSGPAVRAAIASLARPELASLLGAVPPEQVQSLLTGCTAMLLPARQEPYPMIVIEAAALGVPMVVSDECGMSDLLVSEGSAIVVPADLQSFVAAVQRVANSEELRERLSMKARATYERHWSLTALGENLALAYNTR